MKGQHYPSWRYHASKEAVIVKDHKEDKKLGSEWEESPVAFDDKEIEKKLKKKGEE